MHNLHCVYFNVSGSSALVALWDSTVCTDVTIQNLRFSHCYFLFFLYIYHIGRFVCYNAGSGMNRDANL